MGRHHSLMREGIAERLFHVAEERNEYDQD